MISVGIIFRFKYLLSSNHFQVEVLFSFFYCSCFILIAVLNGSMTVSTLGSPKSMSNLIFPFSSELTNAFYIMYFDCRRMVNVRPDGSLEVMVTVQCGRRDGDVRWVVY